MWKGLQTGKIAFIKHRARMWKKVFRGQLIRLTNLTRSEGLSRVVVGLEGLVKARF